MEGLPKKPKNSLPADWHNFRAESNSSNVYKHNFHNKLFPNVSLNNMKNNVNLTTATKTWYTHNSSNAGKKVYSQPFHHIGNKPYAPAVDTNKNNRFCELPKQNMIFTNCVTYNTNRHNSSYRGNVPPPPKEEGVNHVNREDSSVNGITSISAKSSDHKSTEKFYMNTSGVYGANTTITNMNTKFRNLKPCISSNITKNINKNETSINISNFCFQQHNSISIHEGGYNNCFQNSMMETNTRGSNETNVPFWKNKNFPVDTQGTSHNSAYPMQQLGYPSVKPVESTSMDQSQPVGYRRTLLHETNYGTKRPPNPNFKATTTFRAHKNSRTELPFLKKPLTHSAFTKHAGENRQIKVRATLGKKNLINNNSNKNPHQTHILRKHNSGTVPATWRNKIHVNSWKKNQTEKVNNFNLKQQNSNPIETKIVLSKRDTTSNIMHTRKTNYNKGKVTNKSTDVETRVAEENETVFCDICMIDVKTSFLVEHEKKEHVKCPVGDCNEIYNIENLEYHLLSHIKKNNNQSIINDPEEIKKWIEERKKNYPSRKKIQSMIATQKGQKTSSKILPKKRKKPNCLIEELLFENYCTAIGKCIMQKKKKDKSFFVPLLRNLAKTNYLDIDGKEYYRLFDDSENNTGQWKQTTKRHVPFSRNNIYMRTLESLNVHKTPPLLYQLMRNDIEEYERKLMSCIKYVTENNFFDEAEEDIVGELK